MIADDQGLVVIGLGDLVVGDDVRGRLRRWRFVPRARWEFCRLSRIWTLRQRESVAGSVAVGLTSTRTDG